MIQFNFQFNGKTSVIAAGNPLELAAGATFLISQLYHKNKDSEFQKIFRSAMMKVCGPDGFCWTPASDCAGRGMTIDLGELSRQAKEINSE